MQMKVVPQAGDSHNKNKIWKNFSVLNMEEKNFVCPPLFCHWQKYKELFPSQLCVLRNWAMSANSELSK